MIPYGRQCIDAEDIDAVVSVLKGEWLTQGPYVPAFECALADTVGARFAVAFSSGTAALHAAVAAADLGPRDMVVTSSLSFVASANCARYVGAQIGFVDIDQRTLNIDPCSVPVTASALVAVHYAGLPVDLSRLENRPKVVIEDAAHALGARTPDGPVGNCAYSDMCTFSFHPVKAVTTGEGGAVTTNSPALEKRLRMFRNHGMEPCPDKGGWAYDIATVGFNYRMTDMQAALGTSQLRKLESFIVRRNALATRYRRLLSHLPVELPPEAPPGWTHAYHLFPVRVDRRRAIFDGMRQAGVLVQVHYQPIHRFELYADVASPAGNLRATDLACERLLSLPLHPGLTDSSQDDVVETLRALVA